MRQAPPNVSLVQLASMAPTTRMLGCRRTIVALLAEPDITATRQAPRLVLLAHRAHTPMNKRVQVVRPVKRARTMTNPASPVASCALQEAIPMETELKVATRAPRGNIKTLTVRAVAMSAPLANGRMESHKRAASCVRQASMEFQMWTRVILIPTVAMSVPKAITPVTTATRSVLHAATALTKARMVPRRARNAPKDTGKTRKPPRDARAAQRVNSGLRM